ncbi:hypothetical protein ACWIGW_21405 [Nocardia brasiliensis]
MPGRRRVDGYDVDLRLVLGARGAGRRVLGGGWAVPGVWLAGC